VHNSLSWKLTRPLRSIAHRLPRLALLGERILYAARNAVVMQLSSVAAATVVDNRWEPSADIEKQIAAYREAKTPAKRKIVFYTAIFGEYDKLLLPDQIDPDIDYVCFTDRPRNNYGIWQMRSAPFYHPDPTRIARYVKTHPHELFPDHEVAVWLDANIILKGDVHQYIEMVKLQGAHLGFVPHPHRDCFYEEAEACKRLGKDAVEVIDRQVTHYLKHGLPPNQPLFETGFMVAHLGSPETSEALNLWWQQIEQFSRRDQLGLAWVVFQHPKLRIVQLLPPGISVRDHEDFRYFRHNFARVLKIPGGLLQLGSMVSPGHDVRFSAVKERRLQQLTDIPVDIIVCVYNALEDVRLCLQSAREHLLPKHRIIIVNDRSDAETTAYLRQFASGDQQVTLIENAENLGYTRSASLGLASGDAGFRILLNSDTIVSENWALKMLDVANLSNTIGIVGPLSNAAGAQSIPDIRGTGDNTAINVLPKGLSPADIDLACERWSYADHFPRVPLVHGFCFGVKKEVIDRIGLFDDQNFQRFYGEENDYCLRAKAAGFELAIATNTFVFHRKSRSIEEEMRIVHMAEAGQRLRELYGADNIMMACRQVEEHPLLRRIRKEAGPYFEVAQVSDEVGRDLALS
jgi:GT2 family glycosyltransferase